MRSILLDIIPRRFRRRSYLVSGTIFLRALLNFAGLALLIPVLLLILDSESMHTNPGSNGCTKRADSNRTGRSP